MNRKNSPQSVIDRYRRNQQMAPYFMGGLALLFVVAGIIILVIWFTRSGQGTPIGQAATDTPTVTATVATTATSVPATATASATPTITVSPTATVSPTPSGPFEYVVQEGDTCWDLAVKNNVDVEVLLAINTFGNACPIKPGDKILIPLAGSTLPTETALPTDVRGVSIDYIVKTGDTLALIAARFNSTIDAIMIENKLEDANTISVGQPLKIPVNIVTPTSTRAPSLTPTPGGPTATTAPATATATP